MIEIYSKLIVTILNKLNKGYRAGAKYYKCSNPFQPKGKDKNFSCSWFYDTGGLKIYNGSVDGRTFIPIHEACKLLKCTDEYIKFICDYHGINENEIHKYSDKYKLNDIEFDFESIKNVEIYNGKIEKDESYYFIHECDSMSKMELGKCKDYMSNRRLVEIPDVFIPMKIIEGRHDKDGEIIYSKEKLTIVSRHNCGYNKYRFISGERRFTATPKTAPKDFMWCRRDNSERVYLVEGNTECVTMFQWINDDIACMNSTSSLPDDLSNIKHYKEIVVLIDHDTYEQSKEYVDSVMKRNNIRNYTTRRKLHIIFNGDYIQDKRFDFNYLHVHKALDKETIETGHLHEKVFDGKEGFEKNISWQEILNGRKDG